MKSFTSSTNPHLKSLATPTWNNLVYVRDDLVLTSSLKVSEVYNQPHEKVSWQIYLLQSLLPTARFIACFRPYLFKDRTQRFQEGWEMNRDGFRLLSQRLQTSTPLPLKHVWINEFDRMLCELLNKRQKDKLETLRNKRPILQVFNMKSMFQRLKSHLRLRGVKERVLRDITP